MGGQIDIWEKVSYHSDHGICDVLYEQRYVEE